MSRDASTEDIRRAYRKLARENHPDVNKDPGAEDRFKEISEAYEVLRDPEKREQYDRFGANWKAGQDVSGATGFGGRPGGAGFGYGGREEYGDVRVDFGGGDFSDFFDGPVRRSRATRRCPRWLRRLLDARIGPGGGARTVARGGCAGWQTQDFARREARLRGQHPARRARRPAHPSGRGGRTWSKQRPVRRPVLARADQASPPFPPRGPRPLRRPADHAVGGSARRRGRGAALWMAPPE